MDFDDNYEVYDDDDFILEWVECELSEEDENYEKCENCKLRCECLEAANFCCESNELFADIFTGCGRSIDDFWDEID